MKQKKEDQPAKDNLGGKFLTFYLGDEEYGIEILRVQEINGMMPITKVPRMPDYIKGVVNLRGKIIPVMDLRLKFGMEPKEQTNETCIIVTNINTIQTGLIVDRVSEVLDIAEEDIDETPAFGADIDTDYIMGIAKSEGKIRILLSIEKVLSTQEILNLSSLMGDEEQEMAVA